MSDKLLYYALASSLSGNQLPNSVTILQRPMGVNQRYNDISKEVLFELAKAGMSNIFFLNNGRDTGGSDICGNAVGCVHNETPERPGVLVVRISADLNTVFHEVSHYLDFIIPTRLSTNPALEGLKISATALNELVASIHSMTLSLLFGLMDSETLTYAYELTSRGAGRDNQQGILATIVLKNLLKELELGKSPQEILDELIPSGDIDKIHSYIARISEMITNELYFRENQIDSVYILNNYPLTFPLNDLRGLIINTIVRTDEFRSVYKFEKVSGLVDETPDWALDELQPIELVLAIVAITLTRRGFTEAHSIPNFDQIIKAIYKQIQRLDNKHVVLSIKEVIRLNIFGDSENFENIPEGHTLNKGLQLSISDNKDNSRFEVAINVDTNYVDPKVYDVVDAISLLNNNYIFCNKELVGDFLKLLIATRLNDVNLVNELREKYLAIDDNNTKQIYNLFSQYFLQPIES